MSELVANPKGHYHFLKGIPAFSGGVVADEGYEIVYVTLVQELPWREGFRRLEVFLEGQEGGKTALCGIQLRSSKPFTIASFTDFNRGYRDVMGKWELPVGDLNPVARTNVVPMVNPPEEVVMHAFSYTRPCDLKLPRTFVTAGAGEVREGRLATKRIVRVGETTPDALAEKADHVVDLMRARVEQLGAEIESTRVVNVYTAHPMRDLAERIVLAGIPAACRHGINWYLSRPPIIDIEYEMDMRGVREERWVSL